MRGGGGKEERVSMWREMGLIALGRARESRLTGTPIQCRPAWLSRREAPGFCARSSRRHSLSANNKRAARAIK